MGVSPDPESIMQEAPVTGFFDFLGQLDGAGINYGPLGISRMNWRYHHIIDPIKDELDGATVLDLGSHDGRWPYALAAAGATVTGIEGRGDLVAQFSRYPVAEAKSRVTLMEGDFVAEMDRLLAEGERFDVVTCLGVFYHTIQHYRILMQMVAFQPKVIVVDSLFHLSEKAMISVRKDNTHRKGASIAQQEGQAWVPVGWISRPGLELMVETLGYTVEWNEWDVPEREREPVLDYFDRAQHLRRFTCFLRPA
jgi:SAM-dependent methyltransferase